MVYTDNQHNDEITAYDLGLLELFVEGAIADVEAKDILELLEEEK